MLERESSQGYHTDIKDVMGIVAACPKTRCDASAMTAGSGDVFVPQPRLRGHLDTNGKWIGLTKQLTLRKCAENAIMDAHTNSSHAN